MSDTPQPPAITDSHCHLDFPDFEGELDALIARAAEAGVTRMVTICTKLRNEPTVRAIAEGTGALGTLEIHHVAATTDIAVGDLLVTSGLGGRFPVGYPVAVVSEVERDPGQPFARIAARPSAALDRSRHVLLVFIADAQPKE